MRICIVILLLNLAVVRGVLNSTEETQYDDCPPWFFFNETSNQCECFNDPSVDGIIKCTRKGALLRYGYCTTYEQGEGFFVSYCNYFQADSYIKAEPDFIRLPHNISELNDYMCGPLNRKGRVCSECVDGYGIPIFSIVQTCSSCSGIWYRILLYLFLEFVPITVFYFIILFLRINVTSAPMVSFVFYCQIGVSTLYVIANRYIFDNGIELQYLSILTTLYGIWNLDFFRYNLPPFCISQNIKALHVPYLLYVSAFYPLFLTGVVIVCVRLHANNSRVLVWLWKIFKRFISKFTTAKWEPKYTVIGAISDFILLSYGKLLFIFVRTLSFGTQLNLNNTTVSQSLHVTTDPSVPYFGKIHISFAIITIVTFMFTVVPLTLLLALYPIRAFRSLLFKCLCSGQIITTLNTFVEKFCSSYKDGLYDNRDMRGFISMYFFLRLVHLITSQFQVFTITVTMYVCCAVVIAIVRPYKKAYMNNIDALILTNLALIALFSDVRIGRSNPSILTILYQLGVAVLSTIPLIVLIGFIIYKILRVCKCLTISCKKKKKTTKDCSIQTGSNEGDNVSLPDRVLHPEVYAANTLTGVNTVY